MSRTGDWICTYTGQQWFVTDPHPSDVRIEDIAHALSMVGRFGGHTTEFWSVAQHSVECANLVSKWYTDSEELQLHALLHDASESFIGDVVRPLKQSMPDYLALEMRTMEVIYRGLGLEQPCVGEKNIIRKVDNALLMAERRDFIRHRNLNWNIEEEPAPVKLTAVSPAGAEFQFLSMYKRLRVAMLREAA